MHRDTQSKCRDTWRIHSHTWRIQSGTIAQGDALRNVQKSGQTQVMQLVQDVQSEAHRKETKLIFKSCTAMDMTTLKRVSFALYLISDNDLSSYAHKEREMEPRQLSK